MPITTLRKLVHAQDDTVWNLLCDQVKNPGHYQLLSEARIIETGPDWVIREVRIDGIVNRERIVIDEAERIICSELLDHPIYTGTIVTRMVVTAVQSPVAPLYLEVDLRLARRTTHTPGTLRADDEQISATEREMEIIKQKAEELERSRARVS